MRWRPSAGLSVETPKRTAFTELWTSRAAKCYWELTGRLALSCSTWGQEMTAQPLVQYRHPERVDRLTRDFIRGVRAALQQSETVAQTPFLLPKSANRAPRLLLILFAVACLSLLFALFLGLLNGNPLLQSERLALFGTATYLAAAGALVWLAYLGPSSHGM
jgi:hypothetical protein